MKASYQDKLNQSILPWLAISACFAVSLKTAVFSIIIGVFIILWATSGRWKDKVTRVLANPAAIIPIILFLLYGIGISYSDAEWSYKLSWWLKYHKLLYIPIIVSVITNDTHRKYAINAFILSSILVLIISYSEWLNIIPFKDIESQGYIVFKNRIAQSIFMAFTVYLMLHRAMKLKGSFRITWLVLAILATINIFFMVNGRTGQVLTIALTIWFLWENWGIKSLKWIALSIGCVFIAYQSIPSLHQSRLLEIKQEIAAHDAVTNRTSAGERMEFYHNALILIGRNPILGNGTGSFEQEYRNLAKTQKTGRDYVPNPHNQFLLTTEEIGLVGLLVLMLFWFTHWRTSYKLESMQYQITLRGLILTIFIGSFFNSLLLDAGEGRFYCVIAGVLLSAYKKE